MVQELLDLEAHVNIRNDSGGTPLNYILPSSSYKVLQYTQKADITLLLRDRGADINTRNDEG